MSQRPAVAEGPPERVPTDVPGAAPARAHRVLVVDFGSQYTQLIARRVREVGVYCEIHPFDVPDGFVAEFAPRGIILSGGPETVTEGSTPRIPDQVFAAEVPVLGICYGMHAMAAQLGGAVEPSTHREFGHAEVEAAPEDPLLAGLTDGGRMPVWMSHGDKVTAVPPGFVVTAHTESAPVAAMTDPARRLFGVQFHPEVTHTARGADIVRRFARDICGCSGSWTPGHIVEEAVASVRTQVGDGRVVLGLWSEARTRPPMTAVGSSPAAPSTCAMSDVVVVLPWLPATAMPSLRRITSASISALGITGILRRSASASSGLVPRTAEE